MRFDLRFHERARRKARDELAQVFLRDGAEAGRRLYLARRSSPRGALNESSLNYIGYLLLSHERVPEAIAVFELAVESFPDSANTHDSLGEALLQAGQQIRAFDSYQRSLELDPGNSNSHEMLKILCH